MEKGKAFLSSITEEESISVSRLKVNPPIVGVSPSFYEDFAFRGIRVDRIQPGLISCTFKVPPRLVDEAGNLCTGAIAGLVDEIGAAVVCLEGHPVNFSVDMSISYLSTAKLNDELDITSRLLGRKGGYSGAFVLLRNKTTGELVAEGRHSLFGKHNSKM